ncbi:unnamed protein product [Cyclocybe aegerita]|uniref:Uncharacterized protein n=1 Tax=Cyclocybe aegerita TaxID=1973307 RepID=A0A8S0XRH1_CYCAE|nr:unnamed protein product [Cyclocybe aegerita]
MHFKRRDIGRVDRSGEMGRVEEDLDVLQVESPGIEDADTRNAMLGPMKIEAKPTALSTRPGWKHPLVDRAILERLERMQKFFEQGYDDLYNIFPAPSSSQTENRWPPRVTRIPERIHRSSSLSSAPNLHSKSKTKDTAEDKTICDSTTHPRPCRFLLPLRVAEQESKARIHFMQIAQLAKALNRTLVLPNVGKSKIGACFKWPFSSYYDMDSLVDSGDGGREGIMELDDFKAWLEEHVREKHISSQLVSVAPTLPARTRFRREPVFINADVVVHGYEIFEAWRKNLPGCFANKFQRLELETFPVFMSPTAKANRDGGDQPMGDSFVDAFSAISSPTEQDEMPSEETTAESEASIQRRRGPDAQVLVVNWELRHAIFPPSTHSLRYSLQMHDLAARYAPPSPYLVVQWRMETVDPGVLEDCAYGLVDLLMRLLHDAELGANVTTVWFASDYPHPISQQVPTMVQTPLVAKSGTFKDFDGRHGAAIGILQKSFHQQGELGEWKLTDFIESFELDKRGEAELTQDLGVFGILDKLVSEKASLFISGSSQCSRKR